jgi:hypothetical protein
MGADFAQWVAGNSGIPDSASHHLFSRRVGSRGCGGAVSRAKREPPLLRVETELGRLSFEVNDMAAGEFETLTPCRRVSSLDSLCPTKVTFRKCRFQSEIGKLERANDDR